MKIIGLTKDNISDAAVFSGVDMAENIGRTNYRGIIALEDNIFRGGLIWQYKNTDDGCESFIEWFLAANREIARALFFIVYRNDREGRCKELNYHNTCDSES